MFIRILLLMLLFIPHVYAAPVTVNDTAPDWTLQNADGETINFHEDSAGKVTMVLFWASWCPYCRTLMPHLEVIYRKYRSKGLKFYAINVFEKDADPIKHFQEQQFTSTMLLDGDEVAAHWGVKATPGLFIMDRDKKVIYRRPNGVNDVLVKQNVDLKIKYAIMQ